MSAHERLIRLFTLLGLSPVPPVLHTHASFALSKSPSRCPHLPAWLEIRRISDPHLPAWLEIRRISDPICPHGWRSAGFPTPICQPGWRSAGFRRRQQICCCHGRWAAITKIQQIQQQQICCCQGWWAAITKIQQISESFFLMLRSAGFTRNQQISGVKRQSSRSQDQFF